MRFHMFMILALYAVATGLMFSFSAAEAQTTYPISARVPGTCPKGYSPNVETGLCPVSCPSNTAANTNGECVPLPIVEQEPVELLAPRAIDAPTPVDPANSLTCTDGMTWNATQMRCEH